MSACDLGNGAGAAYGQLAENRNLKFAEGASKTFKNGFSTLADAPKQAYTFLTGRTNTQSITTNTLSTAIANVMSNFSFTCSSNPNFNQAIDVSCDSYAPDGSGCTAARNVMQDGANSSPEQRSLNIDYNAKQLRLDAANITGKTDGNNAIDGCQVGSECGKWKANTEAERYACVGCEVSGVEQASHVQFVDSCNSAVNVRNNLQTNLQEQISQMLKNQKDVSGEAGEILSPGSMDCISSDLSSRIVEKMDIEVTQRVLNQLNAQQGLNILDGSISVWMSNVKQWTNLQSVSTVVSNESFINNLYTDEEIKAAANLVAKNSDLEDLAQDLENTTVGLADIFSSVMGQLIFIIAGIMIVVLILFAAMSIADPAGTDALIGSVRNRAAR